MAKKIQGCDYNAQIKKLHNEGPGHTYILYGPEDYLRDSFLGELKKVCIPEGENGFNYHRYDGPDIDIFDYNKAINSMPFLGDRVFIELHDADLSKFDISDVPDYCTVVFIASEVDGRLKIVKQTENNLLFTQAAPNSLYKWIKRRFAANGKEIDDEAIKRLIYISGDRMNQLIPEIDKISGYSINDVVRISDVNAVANHISDADIFDMVDFLCNKNYEDAVTILSELFKNKNNSAISIISSIAFQYRRIYIAKIISNKNELMDILGIKYDFIADKLIRISKTITTSSAKKAVSLCCDCEFHLKSTGADDLNIIKELLISLWKN